jgi:hypothetical protein
MSVKQKLESVPGIYGLDTYASSHTVRVYYNPAEITEARVKSSLFTSSKQRVRNLKKGEVDSVGVWEVGIYRLFDLIDFNNLAYALKNDPGVAGFETRFGEPVMAKIFFDRAKTDPAAIRVQIEAQEVVARKPTGDERVELDFSCENGGRDLGSMDVASYVRLIFRPYDREFNGYEEYTPQQLSVWVFSMPEADAAPLRRYFGSLSSHLSADDGVVRFSTRYMDGPAGLVFFDPAKTTAENVRAALVKPVLTVFRTETETQDMPNPFHIPAEGSERKAADLRLEEE